MAKRSLRMLLSRAFRLRCPRCAGGKMFRGLFSMYDKCSNCKLKYELAPGYFLGSAYINYMATALPITIAYVALHFGAGYSNRMLAGPLVAFCVLFPLGFFRYARALWLAVDCFFDAAIFEQKDD